MFFALLIILNVWVSMYNVNSISPSIILNGCTFVGNYDDYGLNIAQFFSIPYAEPPTDNLRWSPSIPIKNYSEPNICNHSTMSFNSTYHHSRCYQPYEPNGTYPPQNENCIHLDIYTPSLDSNNKLPVLVYVHGGSSYMGGNFQYDLTNLSYTQQLVVVVPNYRLGLLGFLSFSALSAQSSSTKSGNYGLMDIKLSLEWIQQNIETFGGDPQDVTISGQSTGGTAVIAMLSSPSAKGLFHRAISMSGSPNISMDVTTAEKQGKYVVDIFGCNDTNLYPTNASIVECMRNINPQNLTNAYPEQWADADDKIFGVPGPNKTGFNEAGLMIVDGDLVQYSSFDAFAMGINDVPLILGNTQFEADFSPYVDVGNLTTEKAFGAYLNEQFLEWGPGFGTEIWKRFYNEEWIIPMGGPQLVYDAISTDANGFCGTKYLAELAANSTNYKSDIYLYSVQQWPSHPFPISSTWNCSYSFHSYDLFASTFTWSAFQYWGTQYFEPEFSDVQFGKMLRAHWFDSFIDNNEPMDDWTAFDEKNNFNVALLGNGVENNRKYNTTAMVDNYKNDVCQFYLNHGIGKTFWWSN